MTMNTKPKMTAEQRLQRAMERNEANLQKAEEKRGASWKSKLMRTG